MRSEYARFVRRFRSALRYLPAPSRSRLRIRLLQLARTGVQPPKQPAARAMEYFGGRALCHLAKHWHAGRSL